MKKRVEALFMAEQVLDTAFCKTKKKKLWYMQYLYVIPHISNRILDFFWELPQWPFSLKIVIPFAFSIICLSMNIWSIVEWSFLNSAFSSVWFDSSFGY